MEKIRINGQAGRQAFNEFRMHFISWYLKLRRTERTWEMRGNFLQEKSVNPKSWKPAGIEGLFWMKGFPMGSLGSCLWITALWRSRPRWVRKVIQQMSHLEGKGIKQKWLSACCRLKHQHSSHIRPASFLSPHDTKKLLNARWSHSVSKTYHRSKAISITVTFFQLLAIKFTGNSNSILHESWVSHVGRRWSGSWDHSVLTTFPLSDIKYFNSFTPFHFY